MITERKTWRIALLCCILMMFVFAAAILTMAALACRTDTAGSSAAALVEEESEPIDVDRIFEALPSYHSYQEKYALKAEDGTTQYTESIYDIPITFNFAGTTYNFTARCRPFLQAKFKTKIGVTYYNYKLYSVLFNLEELIQQLGFNNLNDYNLVSVKDGSTKVSSLFVNDVGDLGIRDNIALSGQINYNEEYATYQIQTIYDEKKKEYSTISSIRLTYEIKPLETEVASKDMLTSHIYELARQCGKEGLPLSEFDKKIWYQLYCQENDLDFKGWDYFWSSIAYTFGRGDFYEWAEYKRKSYAVTQEIWKKAEAAGYGAFKEKKVVFNKKIKGLSDVQRKIEIPLNFYHLYEYQGLDLWCITLSTEDIIGIFNEVNGNIDSIECRTSLYNDTMSSGLEAVTPYKSRVVDDDGTVVYEGTCAYLLYINNDIIDGTTINIDITYTVNNAYKPEYGVEKVDASMISEYAGRVLFKIYYSLDCVQNNLSTSPRRDDRYELLTIIRVSTVTQSYMESIIQTYVNETGGSLSVKGLSLEENSLDCIQIPYKATLARGDLYLVVERTKSVVVFKNGLTQVVQNVESGSKIDFSNAPVKVEHEGKTWDIIGWTEEVVSYPWTEGYAAADYKLFDTSYVIGSDPARTDADGRIVLYAVLEKEPQEFDDVSKSEFEKKVDAFVESFKEKFTEFFGFENWDKAKKVLQTILYVVVGTISGLLFIWIIVAIVRKIRGKKNKRRRK